MAFLSRLFGKKKPTADLPVQAALPPTAAATPPAAKEEMMTLFDSYGRQVQISRTEWREKVLPANLKNVWSDPEKLYNLAAQALTDGFRADVIPAAQHLYATDPNRVRSACLLGVIQTDEGKLDEAEKLFREAISVGGEEAYLLSNLAKVYSRRGDDANAEEILWHALEVDANQPNALAGFIALGAKRGGATGEADALRKIAGLAPSWRAQLYLARKELEAKHLDEAVALYRDGIERAPKPVPADLLMQMSGDLGRLGFPAEAIALAEPIYDPAVHGLPVGNNLIKAHVDRGEVDAAHELVQKLFKLNRPDWRDNLNYWDHQIAQRRVVGMPVTGPLGVDDEVIEGPIWLPPTSPAASLFPTKPLDELAIAFIGSSATIADRTNVIQQQLSNNVGRLSRGLPLFLSEQTWFSTHARTVTIIPLVVKGGSGFVLAGFPTEDAEAAKKAGESTPRADFAVVLHLDARTEPWKAELRLVRASDAKRLATITEPISVMTISTDVPQIAEQLLTAITQQTGANRQEIPSDYTLPQGQAFGAYMLRIEQLLAVRTAAREGMAPTFLNGEREILDGNFDLAVTNATNVTTRLLLAQTIQSMGKVRPELGKEYAEKINRLQKEMPLAEAPQVAVDNILNPPI